MNIQSEINDILEGLDRVLPSEDISKAREYLSHNEFGIAFELICTQIIENEIKISKKLFNKLKIVSIQLNTCIINLDQIEVSGSKCS